LPIPEEVPIIAAGVASSLGKLNPWAAFAACLVGALLGDCLIYALGYHFGYNLFRHRRFAHLLHAENEARYERIIRQHEWKVLFLARFMVGIRAPVYLAAGILRMPFRRFLLIDLFCVMAVVGTFFGLSYAFGEWIATWVKRSELGLTIVVLAVALSAFGVFWWRRRRSRLIVENQNVEGRPTMAAEDVASADRSKVQQVS
jgi:membrane protein DedA with SNARE-associated domain